jgi:hypothetical protein
LILCSLTALPGPAQTGPIGPVQGHSATMPQPIGQRVGDPGNLPTATSQNSDRLIRALNVDRQKALVSDTNKLLRLVNELNAEIARVNTGSLSGAQLHKVAEIEKLARNVKEKMSTPVRGLPAYPAPFQSVHN